MSFAAAIRPMPKYRSDFRQIIDNQQFQSNARYEVLSNYPVAAIASGLVRLWKDYLREAIAHFKEMPLIKTGLN